MPKCFSPSKVKEHKCEPITASLRGSSQQAIGMLLDRSASTVCRELARGRQDDGTYCPQSARLVYDVRRSRCRRGHKLVEGDTTHRFLRAVTASAIKLRGIVEADETFVLSRRKGERKLDRKARRRGGKASKLGLSHEQVPILMAADRSGATVSAILPAVLQPILDLDALLVTDGCTSYPPCAAAMSYAGIWVMA